MDVPTETFKVAKHKLLWGWEHDFLTSALARWGSVTKAARAVGKHPRAMGALLQKHGIKTCRERPSA
jgi:hypothetical protein